MLKLFGFASIHLRPIAEYYADWRALYPGPSLWAVHLGPSGVPSQPTSLTHLNLSLHLATLQAVIYSRAVRSVCHRSPPRPSPKPATPSLTRGRPFRAVWNDNHLHLHHPSYLIQSHHLPHFIAPGRPFRAVRSCYTSPSSLPILPPLYPFSPFIPSCSGPSI